MHKDIKRLPREERRIVLFSAERKVRRRNAIDRTGRETVYKKALELIETREPYGIECVLRVAIRHV